MQLLPDIREQSDFTDGWPLTSKSLIQEYILTRDLTF